VERLDGRLSFEGDVEARIDRTIVHHTGQRRPGDPSHLAEGAADLEAEIEGLRRRATVRKTIDCLMAAFCLVHQHSLPHRLRDFDSRTSSASSIPDVTRMRRTRR
jgi:hypothetical protein